MGASYKELIAWQRAMQLCAEVYKLTALFPSSERFGITGQMRRCSVSIASNIAEGHARGSNCELQTQLALAEMLGLQTGKSKDNAERLSADVSRLLNGLINKLKG